MGAQREGDFRLGVFDERPTLCAVASRRRAHPQQDEWTAKRTFVACWPVQLQVAKFHANRKETDLASVSGLKT